MSIREHSMIRAWARNWVPPALLHFARRLPGTASRYQGPFSNWAAAEKCSVGYKAADILQRVYNSTLWALDAPNRYEQDSVRFTGQCPPSHALEAVLLGLTIADVEPIVWDIGGALGSHYLRWRSWMEASRLSHWRIIEQRHFVTAGTSLFEGRREPLSFHESLHELSPEAPAVALLSSVLQYIPLEEDPLDAIRQAGPRIIVIDRTPFSADGNEHILIQHTPSKIYTASYPLRTVSQTRISAVLGSEYRLLQSFDTNDGAIAIPGVSAKYQGQIWIRV